MDHLACFLPGMLALGAMSGAHISTRTAAHLDLAEKLMDTCLEVTCARTHVPQPPLLARAHHLTPPVLTPVLALSTL